MKTCGTTFASMILLGVVTFGSVGCGGPSEPTIVRSVSTRTESLSAGFGRFETFTSTASGSVQVTLNWNNAANNFDMSVVANGCNNPEAGLVGIGAACAAIAYAASSAKPETLSFEAAANTTYKIVVGNLGPAADSYTLTIEYPDFQ